MTKSPKPCPFGQGAQNETAETRWAQSRPSLSHLRIGYGKAIRSRAFAVALFSALIASLRFKGAFFNCILTAKSDTLPPGKPFLSTET